MRFTSVEGDEGICNAPRCLALEKSRGDRGRRERRSFTTSSPQLKEEDEQKQEILDLPGCAEIYQPDVRGVCLWLW